MQTFVALLRGVNVGKVNRVPMAELRALLLEQGYSDVVTLLNSGNAVFHSKSRSSAAHAVAISAAITAKFGIQVPVIVKSARELCSIVEENLIDTSDAEHSQLLVAFVQESSSLLELGSLESLVVLPEQFIVGKSAAYLRCANGILESKAAKALLGKAGKMVTTRNWATVLKLRDLANGSH